MERVRILTVVLLATLAGATDASAWTAPLGIGGLDGTADVAVDADGTATVAAAGTLPRLAQRTPGGVFGDPIAVAQLAPGPPAGVDVAAAGHGALAFAWQDGFGRVMAVTRDPGGVVSAPRRLSPADGRGVDGPQVAVDAAGDALVTWLGGLDRGGRGLVYAAYRPAGGQFGPARRLTETAATYPPALAMNAAGRAVIAWRRDARTEAVSVDHGRFGRVSVVGRPQLDGRPTAAVAGDGSAVIAWSEQRTSAPLRRTVATWRPAAGRFGASRVLRSSPEGWTADAPVVAAGERGETVVAWTEGHGPLAQLVAVRRRRGTPRTVRPLGPHRPGSVAAAIGAGGRVTVAWDQRRGGYLTPDLLISSALPGDRFGTPHHVATPEGANERVTSASPAIATGGGRTVLVWTIPSDGMSPARVRWSAHDGYS
jgi:hypothetical protein